MSHRFAFLLFLTTVLPAVGCGVTGESMLDAMKRRAKAVVEANQEKEKREKLKAATAGPATGPATTKVGASKPSSSEDETETPAVDPASKAAAAKSAVAATKTTTAVKSGPDQASAPSSPQGGPSSGGRPPIPVKPDPPLSDIQRRNKSANNLDKIIKALNQYAKEKGTYPTQAIASKKLGKPLLSWRVAILPYLGLAEFYQEFKLNEPWDSAHNAALLAHIPSVYVSPERCDEKTNYLCPHGAGTAWDGIRGKDPLSFSDGADTTLVVLEGDDAVPWTKPEDLPIGPSTKKHLGRLRGEGFLAAFGNDYVAMIHNNVSEAQLSWMLSTDGDDFLADRTIIFDATVPDVALVTNDKKPEDDKPDDAAGNGKKGDKPKDVAAAVAASAARKRAAVLDLPAVHVPPPPKKPVRLPIPTEEQLAKIRGQLRDIYEEEYRQSRTRGDRQKLAAKMLADAPRFEDEAAAYYEILRMTRDIAAQVGDMATTLKAVELLETKFELEPLELRLRSLDELATSIGESGQLAGQLAAEAEKVLISAYESDDYPRALEAHRIFVATLRKATDRAKIAKPSTYRAVIVGAEKAYKLVPAALSALATNPENSEANDVAGKYFCLVKDQWDVGLPMLARGVDLKLRILARMDLEKGKTGAEHVQLADQYWELAQEYKQPQRRGLELRAAFCYASARPLLTGGVDLVKSEKRIEEVTRMYGKEALAKVAGSAPPLVKPVVGPKDDSG